MTSQLSNLLMPQLGILSDYFYRLHWPYLGITFSPTPPPVAKSALTTIPMSAGQQSDYNFIIFYNIPRNT